MKGPRASSGSAARLQGQNSEVWEGEDDSDSLVPDDGYTITISADSDRGWYQSTGGYDRNLGAVSNFTVSESFNPYDNELCEIEFILTANSLFSLGAGRNNDLARHKWLYDCKPMPPGLHTVYWNGRDRFGRILDYYTDRLKLVVVYDSLRLPENSIVVTSNDLGRIYISIDAYAIITSYGEITKIDYTIPVYGRVSLSIYKPLDQLIKTLVDNEDKAAGTYSLIWDGTDSSGAAAAIASDYIVKVDFSVGEKMITRTGNITVGYVDR